MANVFFAISQPAGALPDNITGAPTNPIGTGIVVAAASTAGAPIELRVNMPGAGNAGGGVVTAAEVIKALERFKNFIRQRGFIGGSGGPATGQNYNSP